MPGPTSPVVRRRILLANGAALALTGVFQTVQEVLSHFRGRGVWGEIFHDSPYTIGVIEAHGLAALIGIALVVMARSDPRPFWHGYAAAVHLLLGGANLVFWQTFTEFDKVALGVAATTLHGVLLVAEVACLRAALLTTDGHAPVSRGAESVVRRPVTRIGT